MPGRLLPSFAVGLAVLLSGCAGLRGGKQPVSIADSPRPTLPGQGTFTVQKGRPGFVIGAPHGTTDSATDMIGADLARLTGFSAVIARGFGKLDAEGRRYNVNRPTESVAGASPSGEKESIEARRVYESYDRSVTEAAQGPLRYYIEVHGNAHQESAGRVEIATVGITTDEAWRLRALLELVRDAHLRSQPDAPRLEILVGPVDALRYTASQARAGGLLGRSDKALHIELPRVARTTYRETYTAVLADFLAQSADMLASSKGR
jgi:hypothetical protein